MRVGPTLTCAAAWGVLLCAASIAGAAPDADNAGRQPEIRTGVFRGHPVTYEMIGGKPIFEGDVILDHVTDMPMAGAKEHLREAPQSIGIDYQPYFWPKNAQGVAQIPYTVTNGSANLTTALSQFNATFSGIIQFVTLGSQTDYVNFDFDSSNTSGTCESYVGHVGGEQTVGGSIDCSVGTLLHEMGHVVGLYHEQSRPDRNQYVTVNFGAVIKGSWSNFTPLQDNDQDLGPYDYRSVMHYVPFAFSRAGKPVIESIPAGMPLSNTVGYSDADIDGVKRLYGAVPTSVTVDTNPPGLMVTVDGTTYTTPQVFSWALNSTHTLAVPSGAQSMGGAGYIYGRWNDNTAASHTITVAPGTRALASPITAPAVTVYTANFIQLSQYTATVVPSGAGSFTVSPAAQSYAGLAGVYYVARQAVTLTPTANTGYGFLEWGGVNAPWSANPKSDYIPDGGTPYAVTAYFSGKPITAIQTNPPGLGVYVDGSFYFAPQQFASDYDPSWTPGSTHSVSTYSPQLPYSVNTRFVFTSWSDNGALTHNIKAAATTSKAFAARYTTEYAPVYYATPSCAATVALSPSSADGFYAKGTVVQATSTAAAGWDLTGWQNDLTGTTNPQSMTINDEKLAIANYDTTAAALAVTSLNPAQRWARTVGAPVLINGKGFTSSSIVFVDNLYRASTFNSAQQLSVNLTAADFATPGAFPIGVSNFPSGAPCSAYAARGFTVTVH